jgi:hypothetical protein
MKRRDFLAGSLGTIATASSASTLSQTVEGSAGDLPEPAVDEIPTDPGKIGFCVKPVVTNLIHTEFWEGPCRWEGRSPEKEKAGAEARFAALSKKIAGMKLNDPREVFLDAAHLIYTVGRPDDFFVLPSGELEKLKPDMQQTDAYYFFPYAFALSALQVAKQVGKPFIFRGDSRGGDTAAYMNVHGYEAFTPANDEELIELISVLRARKVFRSTKVLFPTDLGSPGANNLGGTMDPEDLEKRLGIAICKISFAELSAQMEAVVADKSQTQEAERFADQLLKNAKKSYIDRKYVVRSVQFYQAVRSLMNRHGCNAFTIECFEFCATRLPQRWTITPCLTHSLLRNQQCASSCEADMGSLLGMRMLMSVANRSCHQGNWHEYPDTVKAGTFHVNHSVPSMKMNGYDQPDLPYQLGRFVTQGWGTKVVVDFMNNREKTVTIARVDPTARKVLVIRGELVGAGGWGEDRIGCSVTAVIKPPEGRLDECLRKRAVYGNHQQWVYGDWTRQMQQLGETLGLAVDVIS